jgi:hypothetical protein
MTPGMLFDEIREKGIGFQITMIGKEGNVINI